MRTWNYEHLSKYSRLSPADSIIWNRFIDAFPNYYTKVAYDVLVGHGVVASFETDEKFRADYEQLTMKRIDVVGFTLEQIHIIEIKPRASGSAFGQVVNYKRLFDEGFRSTLPTKAVVITDSTTDDDRALFKSENILLFVV